MSRPETALKRCDELLAVNQTQAALSSLSEIFNSKRFRSTPLSSLEPIIVRFLDLCVLLRKGRIAKEGLHMYKNVAQNTSVSSVETVIKHFLEKSKDKLQEAIDKADEQIGSTAAPVEVEDLEASETPESIMLSTVSDASDRDRTYRTVVTPWLRFLWEAYRTALDILRNNVRLEVMYQSVCLEAFEFCLKHSRKTEFRRLAELLRQHLASAQKYSQQQSHAINISDPETLQRHLDIRFNQLNTAVELELWQEAFRSAEDIHDLVAASKRTPRASIMASFYEKMVKVFAVGRNDLFHAAAYSKLHALQASTKEDVTGEKFADLVLLSALSVPLGSAGEIHRRKDGEDGNVGKGRVTLAGLLDLQTAPTRATLLNDALSRNVLQKVSPELKELYSILEEDFHPLSITAKLDPILSAFAAKPETARYVEPLKDVVLARLFQQLAQVYDTLSLTRVIKLSSFKSDASPAIAKARVESYVVDACRRGEMAARLDHATDRIVFEENHLTSKVTLAQPDGIDVLQPTPSALLRSHISRLAQSLYTTLNIVSPQGSPLAKAKQAAEDALANLASQLPTEREAILARQQIIALRKQRADEEAVQREKDAEAARAATRQAMIDNEARRVQQEAKAKELERIKREHEQIRRDEAKKLADSLKIKVDDADALDTDKLVAKQIEQFEKDKKDLAERLRQIAKRMDHTERAYRQEEQPLLARDYEVQQARDKELHESTKAARIQALRDSHAADISIKSRLVHIMPDFENFRTSIVAKAQQAYERELADSKSKIEKAKAERKRDVEQKRAEAREQRLREEEAVRQREEAERAEREEREREEAERKEREDAEFAAKEAAARKEVEERAQRLAEREAERQKIMEEVKAKQQREDEAEARRREKRGLPPAREVVGSNTWTSKRQETQAASVAPVEPAAPAAAPAAGGWRAREASRLGGSAVSAPSSGRSTPLPSGASTPAAAPTSQAPKFVAGGGGWREREAARKAAGGQSSEQTGAGSGSDGRWRRA